MNDDYVSTSVIRQRGQLTLPGNLRRQLDWLGEDKVVQIVLNSDDKVVVTPYIPSQNKNIDWVNVWEKIHLTRIFMGKNGNLSDFIAADRYSH